ncbi:Protein kinase domain protein [compost metagenome]
MQGRTIVLGSEIGRGGEGSVFEIAGLPNYVAKIYHKKIDARKSEKLTAMTSIATADLTSIASWPSEVILDSSSKSVAGIIIPKLSGFSEIHTLYGPGQRKREYPNAYWDFLVHTARNVAAAFETIHSRGHVIGDVNPGNLLVASRGNVKLIDCDSFQITAAGKTFLCEVGVPEWTAPELQGQAFAGIRRNTNHDVFGLALLCFHLLFMGKHPFSGRYSGAGDMPITNAIREFRFAYGRDAGRKSMSPPPNSPTLDMVPARIADMFERAFGVNGAKGNRPTAQEWRMALDEFRQSLKSCTSNPAHKFHAGGLRCPWCQFESNAKIFYFIAFAVSLPTGSAKFDVEFLWQKITAVTPPTKPPLPEFGSVSVTGKPAPEGFARSMAKLRIKRVSVAIALLTSIACFLYGQVVFAILTGISCYGINKIKVSDGEELNRRKCALSSAEQQLSSLKSRLTTFGYSSEFASMKRELETLRGEYKKLPDKFKAERNKHLLKIYLGRHFIDKAKISGIGPGLTLALASYGIETAADITARAVSSVPGFGPKRTSDLLAWRQSLEQAFSRTSQTATTSDLAQLEQNFQQERQGLEQRLVQGLQDLTRISELSKTSTASLLQEYRAASLKVAQAKADLDVLTSASWFGEW